MKAKQHQKKQEYFSRLAEVLEPAGFGLQSVHANQKRNWVELNFYSSNTSIVAMDTLRGIERILQPKQLTLTGWNEPNCQHQCRTCCECRGVQWFYVLAEGVAV